MATGHIGRFNRAAFTEKLLGFVAEHGLSELTMRSLGHALGVSHMAVYHHFPGGREELLQVTTDAVLAEIELPEFDGAWIEWLVQTGQCTFDVLSKYRGVAAYVFSRHPVYVTSGVVEIIDSILAKLLSAGLSDVEAVEVWTVCETWLVGQLWITDAMRDQPATAAAGLQDLLEKEPDTAGSDSLRRVADLLAREHASNHLASGLRDLLTGFARRMGRLD